MSKIPEEFPELDIPDDDDDAKPEKDLFALPDKLRKAREAAVAEEEGEEDEGGGEEEEGEEAPSAEGALPSEGEDVDLLPSEGDKGEEEDEGEAGPKEIVEEAEVTALDEEGEESDFETGSMEDLPVPEQILEGILGRITRKGKQEETPEEIAESIVEEITGVKKPKRRKKKKEMSAEEIAESIATEMITGERPEEPLEEEDEEGGVPHAVKRALSRIISGQLKRTVSMMIPEEPLDEDVTQYLWEGPCSSSSTSTEKTDRLEKYDKENLIEMYKTLFKDKFILTRKNTFLQRKVYEYYRLKKLTSYFDSIEDDEKLESKYTAETKLFEDFVNHDRDRREQINMEIHVIEAEMRAADERLENGLREMLDRERELGVGLMSENGMKVLNEKAVERLLKRQKECVVKLLVSLQKYIRLRDKLENKERQLLMLETIGAEYYLRDYEQLQMENQSYSDKIEERDEELTRLRLSATSSMQILAHIREKANATTNMINDLFESLEMVELHANEIREHISKLKKVREKLRQATQLKKSSAGLLVHQSLIKHFEDSIEECDTLRKEVERFKGKFEEKQQHLSVLRSSMMLVRRESVKLASQRPLDYKIFKQLLMYKRTQMPDREELHRMEVDGGGKQSFAVPEHEKRPTVEQIRKSRPNFFPPARVSVRSYIS